MAGETGLSLALSETPKTGFVATRPIYFLRYFNVILSVYNGQHFLGHFICIFAVCQSTGCIQRVKILGRGTENGQLVLINGFTNENLRISSKIKLYYNYASKMFFGFRYKKSY